MIFMVVPYPDPPIGVFDAAPYREYDPGPGRFTDPGEVGRIPRDPAGVLVVGLTAVGDVLHFLPVAVSLRRAFPRARIGWVVQDKAGPVVEGRSDLDSVVVFERRRWARGLASPFSAFSTFGEILAFRREMIAGGYDLLIDPQGTAKSAFVNILSGVKCRIGFARGFCRELNQLTTTARVVLPTRRMHRVRKSLALLSAAGIDVAGHAARYEVPPGARREGDLTLEKAGLAGKRFMLIHPGTSAFGARKRWPLERFGSLADRAYGEFGLIPAFVIGPMEKAMRDGLLAGTKTAPRIALEPASIAHLGALLSQAACMVGSDSAPLHLASALRVPVVGLYGPTDPVLFAPYYPPAVVVVKGLPCPRCGEPHCNHPVPRMEAISVDEVLDGLRLLFRLTEAL
jgi:heptosyltransferase-1